MKITAAIYFAPGSSSLSDASLPVLDDVAATLRDLPELRVVVVGHCDTTEGVCASGTRAESVLEALVQRGIARDRLSTRDVMAGQMVVEDLGGGDRSKNRRVTFEVVR